MKGKKAEINIIVWIVIAVVILSLFLGLLIRANAQAKNLNYRACKGGAGLGLPNLEGVCRVSCESGEIGLPAGTSVENPKNGCPKEDNPETEDDETKMVECCVKKTTS